MKKVTGLFAALILTTVQNAQASSTWHCSDNDGTSVEVSLGERRVETLAAMPTTGSASWDGPGDSGGEVDNLTLTEDLSAKGIHFSGKDADDTFNLLIETTDTPVAGKAYEGRFSGTQKDFAPASDAKVICKLKIVQEFEQ